MRTHVHIHVRKHVRIVNMHVRMHNTYVRMHSTHVRTHLSYVRTHVHTHSTCAYVWVRTRHIPIEPVQLTLFCSFKVKRKRCFRVTSITF